MKKSVVFLVVVLALVIVFVGFWGNMTGKAIVDNGDYITDSETGLIWQKGWKKIDFIRAVPYCEGLELAGFSDWRLPTIEELETIADVGNSAPFEPVTSFYLSSTETSGGLAIVRGLNEGGIRHEVSKDLDLVARCVREEVVEEPEVEDVVEKEVEVELSLFMKLWNWVKGIFG